MGHKPVATKANLTLIARPEAYFHELVTTALGNQRVQTQPETEFYLVNLLNQFMSADNLYSRDSEGHLKEAPVALMVKEAIDEPSPESQRLLFRHVGDVCLYVAGFFHESISRKLVDLDYYINMGGTAYMRVAERADPPSFRDVYAELSKKFGTFVSVLGEVSEKTTPRTEKDLLRMYERWVATKSDRLAKTLQSEGILPGDPGKKGIQ